jgi:hypothetical protein
VKRWRCPKRAIYAGGIAANIAKLPELVRKASS